VILLPEEARDPSDVIARDSGGHGGGGGGGFASNRVVWVARTNATAFALTRRAANRDRAFGDIEPEVAAEKIAAPSASGAAARAASRTASRGSGGGTGAAASAAPVDPLDGAAGAEVDAGIDGRFRRGGGPAATASRSSSSRERAAAAADPLAVWDFRHGSLPVGAHVPDGAPAPVLRKQKDRSTCALFAAGGSIELVPSEATTKSLGWRRELHAYTLVLDVKFERPVCAACAIFQAATDAGAGDAFFLQVEMT